jgi:hypothetical protein
MKITAFADTTGSRLILQYRFCKNPSGAELFR